MIRRRHFGRERYDPALEKLDADQVRLYGFDLAGMAWCFRCDEQVSVAKVMANSDGDWCPTLGCDGGGFGIDLYPDPWWAKERQG